MNQIVDFIAYFLITFFIMCIIGLFAFFLGLIIGIIAPFKAWLTVIIFISLLLSISTYEEK